MPLQFVRRWTRLRDIALRRSSRTTELPLACPYDGGSPLALAARDSGGPDQDAGRTPRALARGTASPAGPGACVRWRQRRANLALAHAAHGDRVTGPREPCIAVPRRYAAWSRRRRSEGRGLSGRWWRPPVTHSPPRCPSRSQSSPFALSAEGACMTHRGEAIRGTKPPRHGAYPCRARRPMAPAASSRRSVRSRCHVATTPDPAALSL
jgi:hypothetical protein